MDDGSQQRSEKGRFLTGHNGGPGRPKGSRNKLGEAFTEALLADFQRDGVEAIERVRQEEPAQYMKVIASLLPREVKVDVNPLDDMPDDELARLIDLIRAAGGASVSPGGREGEASGPH